MLEKIDTSTEKKIAGEIFDWLEIFVIAISVVILIFTFVLRIGNVDGHSMNPTLYNKDKLIISFLGYEPKAGDIVVVNDRNYDIKETLIKRVIATEGQTVDIDFENGIVLVDGNALNEPYIAELTHNMGDVVFPQTVPDGCVFVMGDNRNQSKDSRWSSVGMIDKRNLMGKAIFRFLPFGSIGAVK